jgi:hypothetical protein
MFETNLDATYAWLGLAVVSVVTAGVVGSFPASPPPDADGVAHTIDSVAEGEYVATAEHGLTADRMRLTTRTVELSDGDGAARAPLRGAPVTPVPAEGPGADGRLRRVLDGTPPDAAFGGSEAFADAAADARTVDHEWRSSPETLTVRRVRYGELRVTLVG